MKFHHILPCSFRDDVKNMYMDIVGMDTWKTMQYKAQVAFGQVS